NAVLRLVQLEAAKIIRRRSIGRPAREGRERPYLANVVAVRLLGEAAHRHVFDHTRTQRADGPGRRSGGHRGVLFELKVAGPSMLGIGCPHRPPFPLTPSPPPPKMHPPRRRPPARAGSFHAPN